ncbi:MAG: chorismate synthase [Thermoguttaceae bacterium]|nr:chorismate synthase [Thermoguttaceae bacterium]
MLSYKTAGESHGYGLFALIEGFPSGYRFDIERIDAELRRRQGGYGRGGRQKIESDHAEILSGILHGRSTGAPIMLCVKNRDVKIEELPELTAPRPGHADFCGAVKYGGGIRAVLERASARETAARVAAGALASAWLEQFDIRCVGSVTRIGSLDLSPSDLALDDPGALIARRDASSVYSLAPEKDAEAQRLIDRARDDGDTLGGVIEVTVFGAPIGLGSHVQYDRKLDARLAMAAMSIQAIKGVEIGLGFEAACRRGSQVHDEFVLGDDGEMIRPTNNAGGIEGGMSNGEPIVVRAAMKPIATLKKPLRSVDLKTGLPVEASFERSDVCAVSAASVVLENVTAFEIAAALLESMNGDSMDELGFDED